MKKIIESYQRDYKEYKLTLYKRLITLIILFLLPFIPTLIFYNVSLFVRILFWIFLSIILLFSLILVGVLVYKTSRPMYETLYKDVIDEAFKDDYTHYEYEGFPSQSPFLNRGKLMTKTYSEVIKYRLSFYYMTNRIDLYSLYTYGKEVKSSEPVFDGIYYVIHIKNQNHFKILSNETLSNSLDEQEVPDGFEKIVQLIKEQMDNEVFISGVSNEIHIAINRTIDHFNPGQINEEALEKLSRDIWQLVKFGRKLFIEIDQIKS